jgi:hypothetical protein
MTPGACTARWAQRHTITQVYALDVGLAWVNNVRLKNVAVLENAACKAG